MKENKELITEIVDRLKSIEDFEYKEGAWESFKGKQSLHTTPVRSFRKYFSAAAALLLLGFAFSYYWFNADEKINNAQIILVDRGSNSVQQEVDENIQDIENKINNDLNYTDNSYNLSEEKSMNNSLVELGNIPYSVLDFQLNAIEMKDKLSFINNNTLSTTMNVESKASNMALKEHLAFANTSLATQMSSSNNLEQHLVPKTFKLSNHFDLGLFVSPYTVADNLKVGAGMTLAYNINNKISVRTGVSYNSYEVGLLKNPLAKNSVEMVDAKVVNQTIYNGLGSVEMLQSSKLALPNIKAVTGFVHSLEIPLEVKYNLNKSFYAVAGLSYSTILSQQRTAEYVENVNLNTFDKGYPVNEMEASKALEMVTKTVVSSEKNVNPNGYNGFINLSVGKKVNLNKKFGVSVEPYYKIPVGEFRKSEMNYSNAGIRIMTNF